MREEILKKLSLACALSGLAILFISSQLILPEESNINEITSDDIGKTLSICGEIVSKKVSNNHIFWDLKDATGTIDFVIFSSEAIKANASGNDIYSFGTGDVVCSGGTVDEYPKGSGELEIIYRGGEIRRV